MSTIVSTDTSIMDDLINTATRYGSLTVEIKDVPNKHITDLKQTSPDGEFCYNILQLQTLPDTPERSIELMAVALRHLIQNLALTRSGSKTKLVTLARLSRGEQVRRAFFTFVGTTRLAYAVPLQDTVLSAIFNDTHLVRLLDGEEAKTQAIDLAECDFPEEEMETEESFSAKWQELDDALLSINQLDMQEDLAYLQKCQKEVPTSYQTGGCRDLTIDDIVSSKNKRQFPDIDPSEDIQDTCDPKTRCMTQQDVEDEVRRQRELLVDFLDMIGADPALVAPLNVVPDMGDKMHGGKRGIFPVASHVPMRPNPSQADFLVFYKHVMACVSDTFLPREELQMEKTIRYNGWRSVLSNFYEAPMIIAGIRFQTLEHAYVTLKMLAAGQMNPTVVRQTNDVYKLKKMSSHLDMPAKWHQIKASVMEVLLVEKAAQVKDFRDALLCTQGKFLSHSVQDSFWGHGGGSGIDLAQSNTHGVLLMALRAALVRSEEAARIQAAMWTSVDNTSEKDGDIVQGCENKPTPPTMQQQVSNILEAVDVHFEQDVVSSVSTTEDDDITHATFGFSPDTLVPDEVPATDEVSLSDTIEAFDITETVVITEEDTVFSSTQLPTVIDTVIEAVKTNIPEVAKSKNKVAIVLAVVPMIISLILVIKGVYEKTMSTASIAITAVSVVASFLSVLVLYGVVDAATDTLKAKLLGPVINTITTLGADKLHAGGSPGWKDIIKILVGLGAIVAGLSTGNFVIDKIHKVVSMKKDMQASADDIAEVLYATTGVDIYDAHAYEEVGRNLENEIQKILETQNSKWDTQLQKKAATRLSQTNDFIRTLPKGKVAPRLVASAATLAGRLSDIRQSHSLVKSRPVPLNIYMYGDKGVGKTHLVEKDLIPRLAKAFGVTSDIYNLKSGKHFPDYHSERWAVHDEFGVEKNPQDSAVLPMLNVLTSGGLASIPGASIASKTSQAAFNGTFFMSNLAPAQINIGVVDEAKEAFLSRLTQVHVLDPGYDKSYPRDHQLHRKDDFSHLQFTVIDRDMPPRRLSYPQLVDLCQKVIVDNQLAFQKHQIATDALQARRVKDSVGQPFKLWDPITSFDRVQGGRGCKIITIIGNPGVGKTTSITGPLHTLAKIMGKPVVSSKEATVPAGSVVLYDDAFLLHTEAGQNEFLAHVNALDSSNVAVVITNCGPHSYISYWNDYRHVTEHVPGVFRRLGFTQNSDQSRAYLARPSGLSFLRTGKVAYYHDILVEALAVDPASKMHFSKPPEKMIIRKEECHMYVVLDDATGMSQTAVLTHIFKHCIMQPVLASVLMQLRILLDSRGDVEETYTQFFIKNYSLLKDYTVFINIEGNVLSMKDGEAWIYGELSPYMYVVVNGIPSIRDRIKDTVTEIDRQYYVNWRRSATPQSNKELYVHSILTQWSKEGVTNLTKLAKAFVITEAEVAGGIMYGLRKNATVHLMSFADFCKKHKALIAAVVSLVAIGGIAYTLFNSVDAANPSPRRDAVHMCPTVAMQIASKTYCNEEFNPLDRDYTYGEPCGCLRCWFPPDNEELLAIAIKDPAMFDRLQRGKGGNVAKPQKGSFKKDLRVRAGNLSFGGKQQTSETARDLEDENPHTSVEASKYRSLQAAVASGQYFEDGDKYVCHFKYGTKSNYPATASIPRSGGVGWDIDDFADQMHGMVKDKIIRESTKPSPVLDDRIQGSTCLPPGSVPHKFDAIWTNLVSLIDDTGSYVQGVMLNDTYGITVLHAFYKSDNVMLGSTQLWETMGDECTRAICIFKDSKREQAFFRLECHGDPVKLPRVKDLTRHLLPMSKIRKLRKAMVVKQQMTALLFREGDFSVMERINPAIQVSEIAAWTTDAGIIPFSKNDAFQMQEGDCGTPVLAQDPDGPADGNWHFMGMHVLMREATFTNFCCIVTRETWNQFAMTFKKSNHTLDSVPFGQGIKDVSTLDEIHGKTALSAIPTLGVYPALMSQEILDLYIDKPIKGSLIPKGPGIEWKAAIRNKIPYDQKSKSHKLVPPPPLDLIPGQKSKVPTLQETVVKQLYADNIPEDLEGNKHLSYARISAADNLKRVSHFYQEKLRQAGIAIGRYLLMKAGNPVLHPLDIDTAINGNKGYYEPMDVHTGLGPTGALLFNGVNQKAHVLDFSDESEKFSFQKTDAGRYYKAETIRQFNLAKDGRRYTIPNAAGLKAELLVEEKVWKKRVFHISPMPTVLNMRRLLYPIQKQFIKNGPKSNFVVAMDPVAEWDELIHDMLRFGTSAMDIDFSSFDFTVPFAALQAAGHVFAEMYANNEHSEEYRTACKVFMEEAALADLIVGQSVLERKGGVPSGIYGTSLVDGTALLCMIYVCYSDLVSEDDNLISATQFFTDLSVKTCGDDCIIVLKDKNSPFDYSYVERFFSMVFGMKATPGDKTNTEQLLKSPVELSFISRKTVVLDDMPGMFLSQLKACSVLSASTYTRYTNPKDQLQGLENNRLEFVPYGRESYNKHEMYIRDFALYHDLKYTPMQFDDVLREIHTRVRENTGVNHESKRDQAFQRHLKSISDRKLKETTSEEGKPVSPYVVPLIKIEDEMANSNPKNTLSLWRRGPLTKKNLRSLDRKPSCFRVDKDLLITTKLGKDVCAATIQLPQPGSPMIWAYALGHEMIPEDWVRLSESTPLKKTIMAKKAFVQAALNLRDLPEDHVIQDDILAVLFPTAGDKMHAGEREVPGSSLGSAAAPGAGAPSAPSSAPAASGGTGGDPPPDLGSTLAPTAVLPPTVDPPLSSYTPNSGGGVQVLQPGAGINPEGIEAIGDIRDFMSNTYREMALSLNVALNTSTAANTVFLNEKVSPWSKAFLNPWAMKWAELHEAFFGSIDLTFRLQTTPNISGTFVLFWIPPIYDKIPLTYRDLSFLPHSVISVGLDATFTVNCVMQASDDVRIMYVDRTKALAGTNYGKLVGITLTTIQNTFGTTLSIPIICYGNLNPDARYFKPDLTREGDCASIPKLLGDYALVTEDSCIPIKYNTGRKHFDRLKYIDRIDPIICYDQVATPEDFLIASGLCPRANLTCIDAPPRPIYELMSTRSCHAHFDGHDAVICDGSADGVLGGYRAMTPFMDALEDSANLSIVFGGASNQGGAIYNVRSIGRTTADENVKCGFQIDLVEQDELKWDMSPINHEAFVRTYWESDIQQSTYTNYITWTDHHHNTVYNWPIRGEFAACVDGAIPPDIVEPAAYYAVKGFESPTAPSTFKAVKMVGRLGYAPGVLPLVEGQTVTQSEVHNMNVAIHDRFFEENPTVKAIVHKLRQGTQDVMQVVANREGFFTFDKPENNYRGVSVASIDILDYPELNTATEWPATEAPHEQFMSSRYVRTNGAFTAIDNGVLVHGKVTDKKVLQQLKLDQCAKRSTAPVCGYTIGDNCQGWKQDAEDKLFRLMNRAKQVEADPWRPSQESVETAEAYKKIAEALSTDGMAEAAAGVPIIQHSVEDLCHTMMSMAFKAFREKSAEYRKTCEQQRRAAMNHAQFMKHLETNLQDLEIGRPQHCTCDVFEFGQSCQYCEGEDEPDFCDSPVLLPKRRDLGDKMHAGMFFGGLFSGLGQGLRERAEMRNKNKMQDKDIKMKEDMQQSGFDNQRYMQGQDIDNQRYMQGQGFDNQQYMQGQDIGNKRYMQDQDITNSQFLKGLDIGNTRVLQRNDIRNQQTMQNRNIDNRVDMQKRDLSNQTQLKKQQYGIDSSLMAQKMGYSSGVNHIATDRYMSHGTQTGGLIQTSTGTSPAGNSYFPQKGSIAPSPKAKTNSSITANLVSGGVPSNKGKPPPLSGGSAQAMAGQIKATPTLSMKS